MNSRRMNTQVIRYQSNNEVYQSVKYSSKVLSKDAYTAARIYNLVGVIEISLINTLAYDFKSTKFNQAQRLGSQKRK